MPTGCRPKHVTWCCLRRWLRNTLCVVRELWLQHTSFIQNQYTAIAWTIIGFDHNAVAWNVKTVPVY